MTSDQHDADVPDSPITERASRESLLLGAVIERNGLRISGRIRNISATGALLQTSEKLGVGEAIIVSFRGIQRAPAEVKRQTKSGFGIHFTTPIDPTACRQIPAATEGAKDFVLNLREGFRRPIWDNTGGDFRRPRIGK